MKKNLKMLLSVIVPVLNEEEVVESAAKRLWKLQEQLKDFNLEIIFVDDGSYDNSLRLLEKIAANNKAIKVISFSRNFGHQTAISAGLIYAKGDFVAIIDADLQDPPEEIPKMLKKNLEGFDVVYGKRISRQGETMFKRYTASLFYKIFNYFSYVDMPTNTGDFRVISRRAVDSFNSLPEKDRFVRGMFAWIGFNVFAHEYVREKRLMGITKYPLRKMIDFAASGIISFSNRPLRIVTRIGFLIMFITIIISIIIAYLRLFMMMEIPYLTSILLVIAFFSSVQILIMGIIGEYIAKIFEEVKNRPLFIVKKEINFKKRGS